MMDNVKETISVTYINSFNEDFSIELSLHNQFDTIMEIIRDNSYEDWGHCEDKSLCHNCHVSINRDTNGVISEAEKKALSLLPNKTKFSRLACHINIDKDLDGATLKYLGPCLKNTN